jgi:hypothetical protein
VKPRTTNLYTVIAIEKRLPSLIAKAALGFYLTIYEANQAA